MTSPQKTIYVDLGDGKQREVYIVAAKQKRLDEAHGDYFQKLSGTKWSEALPLITEALKDTTDLNFDELAESFTRAMCDHAVNQICKAINGKTLDELVEFGFKLKNAQSGQATS